MLKYSGSCAYIVLIIMTQFLIAFKVLDNVFFYKSFIDCHLSEKSLLFIDTFMVRFSVVKYTSKGYYFAVMFQIDYIYTQVLQLLK